MQQRPRSSSNQRPVQSASRPVSQANRRPASASGQHPMPPSGQRPAPTPGQRPAPQRRRLTPRQIEMLRRKRRREAIRNFAILGVVVVVVIVAVVLILQPKEPPRSVVVGRSTPSPTPTASPTPTPSPTPSPTPTPTNASGTNGNNANLIGIVPSTQPSTPSTPSTPSKPSTPGELRSVHFRVTGDIMITEEQLAYAKAAGGGSYEFHPQLALIYQSLASADYTIGNLETTIGKYKTRDYSGYPQFNAPETLLDALRDCGFDFFTLANNHMLDRWFDGMKNTVTWVEEYGFEHVGAYRTQAERDTPKIVEINGIKFGFVAYTHTTNTMEEVSDKAATEYGVPFFRTADIEGDIQALRNAGAEVVIAIPHWGGEYIRTPDSDQRYYAQRIANAGADIILGSHSHMVQPMGYLTGNLSDGSSKQVFIIYSLGNFLSSHTVQYTDEGIILDFTVNEQPDGTFTVDNVGYVPVYCWIHDNTVQVLSSAQYLNNPPAGMSASAYARMKETYTELTTLLDPQFKVLAS